MTMHSLKELSCYFNQTIEGDKNFTIRQNDDRGFQKGDGIYVTEIPDGDYQPQTYQAEITNVCTYKQQEGYVVLGIRLTHVNHKVFQ